MLVLDGKGSPPVRVRGVTDACCVAFSPDGYYVAFERRGDLWVVEHDGSELHRVAALGRALGVGARRAGPRDRPQGVTRRDRRVRHRVRRRRRPGHPGDPAARAPRPRHGVGRARPPHRRLRGPGGRHERQHRRRRRLSCSCSRSPGRTARTAPPCAPRPRSPFPSSIPRRRRARCWRAGRRTSRASRSGPRPGTAPPSASSHRAAAASRRSRARSYAGRGCSGRGTATACSSSKEPPAKPARHESSCCARTRRPAGPSPAATKRSPTRRGRAPARWPTSVPIAVSSGSPNRDGADAHRVAAAGEGVAAPRWLPRHPPSPVRARRACLAARRHRRRRGWSSGRPGGRSDRAPAGGPDGTRPRALRSFARSRRTAVFGRPVGRSAPNQ